MSDSGGDWGDEAKPVDDGLRRRPIIGWRSRGIVRWFNAAKGYGFIRDGSGSDIFVHISQLQWGCDTLVSDSEVEYDVGLRGANKSALNVRPWRPRSSAEPSDSEFIAATMIGDSLKLISVTPSGYEFLDSHEALHHLVYIYASETRAQESAVEELEALINDAKARERDFQGFFEKHPDFIMDDEYKAIHPHVVLRKPTGEALIPDFVLEPTDQYRFCDLLDLKLPRSKLFRIQRNRNRFSAGVAEVRAQMRTYQRHFDDDASRQAIETEYGLRFFQPRLFVIMGRRGNVSPIEFRKMELDEPALTVRTYDDILIRARAKASQMKNRHRRD